MNKENPQRFNLRYTTYEIIQQLKEEKSVSEAQACLYWPSVLKQYNIVKRQFDYLLKSCNYINYCQINKAFLSANIRNIRHTFRARLAGCKVPI